MAAAGLHLARKRDRLHLLPRLQATAGGNVPAYNLVSRQFCLRMSAGEASQIECDG